MSKPKVEVGRWDEQDPRHKGPGPAGQGPAIDPNSPIAPLEVLAYVLDSCIPLFGGRYRIGIEPLLGLIPVVGDLLGALVSSFILFTGAKMGVPRVTLMRMGFNVLLEAVVGVIPFAGDMFDFVWKANQRNIALLRAHVQNPARARRGDWIFATLCLALVLAVLFLLGWGAFALVSAMWGYFSTPG